ncbi:MAG TPA: hypothetical protein ENH13_01065 [Euryarchaeota archaeon]|nr:hypothetical protein [Euryarchaeota archaeon]
MRPTERLTGRIRKEIRAVKRRATEVPKAICRAPSKATSCITRKARKAANKTKTFFQIPESDIHPSIRTLSDFHVDKNGIYCNGIYAKTLLIKFLPEREPSLIIKELLNQNNDIDISFHLYPDQGKQIRKTLGRYYRTLTGQIEEMRSKGKVSLTYEYQEEQLKEIYRSSLGGQNIFLATILITAYANTPKQLKAAVELTKKALRPAGLITDPLTFRQEQAFLSSIPLGMDKIKKHTAIDVGKLAEGTLPFIEKPPDYQRNGVPIGIELKEGT